MLLVSTIETSDFSVRSKVEQTNIRSDQELDNQPSVKGFCCFSIPKTMKITIVNVTFNCDFFSEDQQNNCNCVINSFVIIIAFSAICLPDAILINVITEEKHFKKTLDLPSEVPI